MSPESDTYDLLFRQVRVIDGTGAPSRVADVAVQGPRIAAVGDLARASAKRAIDADGLALAPGFIDVHTHDDTLALGGSTMEPKLTQGVTTVVTGNCGISLAPLTTARELPAPLNLLGDEEAFRFPRFGDYVRALKTDPPTLNVAPLVGHSTLRVATMDRIDRPATPGEIERMKALLAEALDDGAIGFSTGLTYPPAIAALPSEVVELLHVVSAKGAIYTTHMRNEDDCITDALDETFDSARQANVPVVISHHKCMGVRNHGRSAETLKMIDAARKRQPVGLDVYPYVAGSSALLPNFIAVSSRVLITDSVPHPEMSGRNLADIAVEWGCDVLEAAERLNPAGAIYFHMSEEDMRRILAYPHSMIGSDGIPGALHPHPRLWGTFPRVLGRYARELGLLTLEQAVHKMSGLAARTFGLKDRGEIRTGAFADLVLFDPERVTDMATFEDPIRSAAGIKLVVVNGRGVFDGGSIQAARPGRVLRRN
jgi:N-acyl-D-amino-acid deacylase